MLLPYYVAMAHFSPLVDDLEISSIAVILEPLAIRGRDWCIWEIWGEIFF